MSSTLVVGAPTLTVPSLSSNALSPPSPSRANSVFLLTLATSPTPPTSPVTASSKQSQLLSSALQSAMSASTVTTIAAPSSASQSTPSSTFSPSSSGTSPMSSSTPSIVASTSTNGRPTTSTPQASARPTTSSTTTAPGTTQPSIQTSPPLSTTTLGRATSSIPVTTSDTPFTTTVPLTSSQGSPAAPLITVTESTTIFIISTNSEGQVMTSIPPVVTEVITTTGNGGIVTTITQAVVNPTLASNNSTTGESPFFANTGAVVGVFVVVGLASASILLWILFAVRHRQRMKRLEQDSAVEAVVAGLNRAPLDDDYEDASPISPSTRHQLSSEMDQRSTLFGLGDSGSLATSAHLLGDTMKDSVNSRTDPAVRRMTNYPKGYIPARATSIGPFPDDLGSSRDCKSSYGHTPTYSAGSFEPLLANYAQNTQDQDSSSAAVQRPRNHSSQHPGSSLVLQGYSTDESPGNRSRPSSRRQNSSDSFVLHDDDDYTHYVLMVRNIPDDHSEHSL